MQIILHQQAQQRHLPISQYFGGRITIHILYGYRLNCGEEKDDAEEGRPRTRPDIDVPGCSSKVDWSRSKVLRPDYFTHDWDAITPIEGDSTDLELAKL